MTAQSRRTPRSRRLIALVGVVAMMGVIGDGFSSPAGAAPSSATTRASTPSPTPGTTPAATTTGVYLSSEPGTYGISGDYLGQGQNYAYNDVTYYGSEGVESPEFRFDGASLPFFVAFAPPHGQLLTPGVYEEAENYFGPRDPGRPGLSVGLSNGCGYFAGRFVVTDATYDSEGNPLSFAATFEVHCEGAAPALFGSLSYHSRVPVTSRTISSSFMEFYSKHNRPETLPITVTNTGSTPLHPSYDLVGPQAANYTVRSTSCRSTLAPGTSCSWDVRYRPGTPIQSDATFEYFDELSPAGAPNEEANAGTGWHISLGGINTDRRLIPCQYNGIPDTAVATGLAPGAAVTIHCTGLAPDDAVDVMEASPLFAKTGSGDEQDAGSFQRFTADASGTLDASFMVPDPFTAADPHAVCPPTPQQVAAGEAHCLLQLSNAWGDGDTAEVQYGGT
jgi:hypothetical protein